MGKAIGKVAGGISKFGGRTVDPLGVTSIGREGLLGGIFGGGGGQQFLEADPIAKDVFETQKAGLSAQRAGIQALRKAGGRDAGKVIRGQAARETRGVQGLAQDEIRRVRESISRRGLGPTSLGQLAETSASRRSSERTADIQASIPERIEALRRNRASALLAGGRSIVGQQNLPVRLRREAVPQGPGRLGALGTIGGGVLGGIFGGPTGAAAGVQAGGAIGGVLG